MYPPIGQLAVCIALVAIPILPEIVVLVCRESMTVVEGKVRYLAAVNHSWAYLGRGVAWMRGIGKISAL